MNTTSHDELVRKPLAMIRLTLVIFSRNLSEKRIISNEPTSARQQHLGIPFGQGGSNSD